jgi:hypothetical protein
MPEDYGVLRSAVPPARIFVGTDFPALKRRAIVDWSCGPSRGGIGLLKGWKCAVLAHGLSIVKNAVVGRPCAGPGQKQFPRSHDGAAVGVADRLIHRDRPGIS